jgi:hypothetical protein
VTQLQTSPQRTVKTELGSGLTTIVHRIQRLEEWSRFELMICNIRDALSRFDDFIQPRLSAARQDFADRRESQQEVQREWEHICINHVAPLNIYKVRI